VGLSVQLSTPCLPPNSTTLLISFLWFSSEQDPWVLHRLSLQQPVHALLLGPRPRAFPSTKECLEYYHGIFLGFCGPEYVKERFSHLLTDVQVRFARGNLPRNILVDGSKLELSSTGSYRGDLLANITSVSINKLHRLYPKSTNKKYLSVQNMASAKWKTRNGVRHHPHLPWPWDGSPPPLDRNGEGTRICVDNCSYCKSCVCRSGEIVRARRRNVDRQTRVLELLHQDVGPVEVYIE